MSDLATLNLFCSFADDTERLRFSSDVARMFVFSFTFPRPYGGIQIVGVFMGILSGVIQFRGRVGQLVGRKLADTSLNSGNASGRVSIAAYQPSVSNPKTEPQATQRMKMTAAVAFYRMMSQVLNNAFQSEKYGTRSHNKFLSIAMRQSAGHPFLEKGTSLFFPGEYVVSIGSIPSVNVLSQSTDGSLVTSLNAGGAAVHDTFGQLSQKIVNANFGLLNGDRITFIGFGRRNDGSFAPVFSYIVLNTESAEASALVLDSQRLVLSFENTVGDGSNIGFSFTNTGYDALVGGAVIVSRAPIGSSATWLRSNATVWLNDEYKAQYMGVERFNAALATFTKSAAVLSSDWYLNLGLYSNVHGDSVVGSLTITSTNERTVSLDGGDSVDVAILTLSDGTARAGIYTAQDLDSGYQLVSWRNSKYIGTGVDASTATLQRIKAVVPAVTDYLVVPANMFANGVSSGENAGEDRP